MPDVLNDEYLKSIANAIRIQRQETYPQAKYRPSEMPDKIRTIDGIHTSGKITITENGSFEVAKYDTAVVQVPWDNNPYIEDQRGFIHYFTVYDEENYYEEVIPRRIEIESFRDHSIQSDYYDYSGNRYKAVTYRVGEVFASNEYRFWATLVTYGKDFDYPGADVDEEGFTIDNADLNFSIDNGYIFQGTKEDPDFLEVQYYAAGITYYYKIKIIVINTEG